MRLEELDISYNKVSAHNFEKLLKNLSKNKRLRDVNLSWNNMTEREVQPVKRAS
jgi:Ran GTPase-activating protein (RanGAP) involved in mRNA processing and transport